MNMLFQEKQASLDRNKAIILAALDYQLAKHTGTLVCDDIDFIANHYKQQKLQTEKYYEERQLNKLEQKLTSLTENLISQVALFTLYLKQTTGYEIDLVADLRTRVEEIILKNEIRSPKDYQDVCKMLSFYGQTGIEDERVTVLNKLINLPVVTVNQKASGKDPFVENLYLEATSPDGSKKLRVEKSGKEENALTYIVIYLSSVSSGFYDVMGHHPDIKAYWKDNHTIVVKTKREYKGSTKTKKIESNGEITNIEYIES
ncbi:MAG: hypothetical protein EOP42_18270 [Sphingobacteriaceae bacterium]|nr:MAG: hypothetical protein EOP42_18270 [Sphingobacteriaceae bacterium]